MSSADNELVVTFNGEIYNFLELRRELEAEGQEFRTKTDTEVLLACYRRWGMACLEHLRGMFAFALWDTRSRRLFIARDRLGKKPLFYRLDGDGIAFASEPKAFLSEPSFVAEPDLDAVDAYLTYQYVPSPCSAFKGVRKLPPGHSLEVVGGDIKLNRYWSVSYSAKRVVSESDAAEALLAHLEEAVKVRLISDVPLGAFLSGGIDSGSVVALMARLSQSPVKTFSIGFEEEEFNELPFARMVAQRYGTEHHEFVVRPDALAVLPQLVWHYGEPFADPSAIPTYYLAELARKHVTVALNGDAGDENLAGYSRYVLSREAAGFDSLPITLRQPIIKFLRRTRPLAGRASLFGRAWGRVHRVVDMPPERFARRGMLFSPELKRWAFTPDFLEATRLSSADRLLVNAWAESDAQNPIDAQLAVDMRYYLPDCLLVKVDIATMAHGLEGRSPMLDHAFVEFCASLPPDLKLRGTQTKYLLKKVARGLLPPEITDRPKKGFGVPLARWFRGELRQFAADLLLDGRMARRGLFRQQAIETVFRQHLDGVADWNRELWALVMLESWHRMFLDDRLTAPPTRVTPVVLSA